MIKHVLNNLCLPVLLAAGLACPGLAQDQTQDRNRPKNRIQTQYQTPDQSGKAQLTAKEKQFLSKAAMDNMAEIRLGKMAQDKSKNDRIQQFGQTLQTDHSDAQDKVKALAQQYGVDLPQNLDQKNQATAKGLSNMSGMQFDRQLIQTEIPDHQKAVQEFQDMAKNAENADIREFASNTVPVLQKHLDMAQQVQRELRQSTSNQPQTGATSQTAAGEKPAATAQGAENRPTESAQANRNERALPATASDQPVLALLGLLFLAGAAELRFGRNHA